MAVIQEHRRLRRWYHEKIRAAVAIEITDDWDTFGLLERTRSIFLEHTTAPAGCVWRVFSTNTAV